MATHNTNHASNAAVVNNSKRTLSRANTTATTTGVSPGSLEALQTVYPPALVAGWTQSGTNPTKIKNAGGNSTYSVGGRQRSYKFPKTIPDNPTGAISTTVMDIYGRILDASGGNISVAALGVGTLVVNSDTAPGNNAYATDKSTRTYYTKVGSIAGPKVKV